MANLESQAAFLLWLLLPDSNINLHQNNGISMASTFAIHVYERLTVKQLRCAFEDLLQGFLRYPLWMTIGLQELRHKYRRSVIGPFWITLSMGVMIFALGVLYGMIFNQPLADYLPYLAAGFVTWGLIQALVLEGSASFINSEHYIRQLLSPISIYCYRVVWGALLNFLHTIWIFFIVALIFSAPLNISLLWVVPALFLLLINGLWIGLLLGLMSARFRDVPLIAANITQVMFFITPIIWSPEMIPERIVLLDWNPFYHMVEIMRSPLLGQAPELSHWLAVISVTIVGWVAAIFFFTIYRWRIAYWV